MYRATVAVPSVIECPLTLTPRACRRAHSELQNTIRNIGENVDEDELEEMMAEADKNGDGEIDYNEFVSILVSPLKVPARVVIEDHLKPFMPKEKEKKES